MKRTLFCFAMGLFCSVSFATTLSSSSPTLYFANSLGNVFKNQKIVNHGTGYQPLATTYVGQDVSNQPLPTLRAIA